MTRVYISSTYDDLKEYREAVVRVLRKMNKEVVAMEDYVAADARPLDKCREDVGSCDIYVGVFAWRYGYIPAKDNPGSKSITELEYRHAEEQGKECLLFLLDAKGTPWPADWMDAITGEGDAGRRIKELRDELAREKTVSFFRTSQELATLVGVAVSNWEERQRRESLAAVAGAEPSTGALRGAEERLSDLDDHIHQALQEIKKWENALRYEDDPDRRDQYRNRIVRLRAEWEEYSLEYGRLEAKAGPRSATTQRAAEGLRQMDRKLEAMAKEQRMPGIGLALSGGGFRATLYHLGSLWRLNEMGLLGRLSEISSVSAGSILAGIAGLHWKELRFDDRGVAGNFSEAIAARVRTFCAMSTDLPSALIGLLLPFRNPGDVLVSRFRKHLFGDATLQDLPENPRITFYATSLQTGNSVRFSRPYLAEYRLGVVWEPRIPLAQAVGASCASPPTFCPVVLQMDPDAWDCTEGADLYPDKNLRSRLSLADGGLYDDLGLERIWDRYQTVLVSDAGLPFQVITGLATRFVFRLFRTLQIVASASRRLRKRKLFEDLTGHRMEGAYWGIGSKIGSYGLEKAGLPGPMTSDSEATRSLSRLRTRFNAFSDEEQGRLINWGYALTDAAIRRWVFPNAPGPVAWPVPEHSL